VTNLIRRNAIAAASMTAIWLLAVFVDQKVVRLPGHEYELPAIVLAVFLVFAWVNRGLVPRHNLWLRVPCVALIASALTAAWLPITILCAMQFHLLLGGTL